MRLAVLVLILVPCRGVELDATATNRKKGRDWDLVLAGKTRGIPDGAIITLRFTKVETKVRWKDRAILTEAGATPWHRKVYVGKNAFSHLEGFDMAGEVQLEICFVPEDQESDDIRDDMGMDYRAHKTVRTFRIGRPADAAGQLRRDYDLLIAQLDEAKKILKALAAAEGNKVELETQKKALDKHMQKVREAPSILSGSQKALETILMDLYNSVGALPKKTGEKPKDSGGEHSGGTGAPTSQLTGQDLSVETADEILAALREIGGRELGLVTFLSTKELCDEAKEVRAALEAKPDGAAWSRHKTNFERDLAMMKHLWKGLRLKFEGMDAHLDAVDAYVNAVVAAVEKGGANPEPLNEDALKRLEKLLRNVE